MKKVLKNATDNAMPSLETNMSPQTDDSWTSAITQGIAQANRGELIDHAVVKAKWEKQLTGLTTLSD